MPYKRRPKKQKPKHIRRNTGARAQSKQIQSLSRSVNKLTKSQYENVCTTWNRPNLSIDLLTGGTNAYICPIPISMCNVFGQNTTVTQGDADQRIQWTDNLALAAMDNFRKSPLFGSSENARDSPEYTHMGSYIRWRLINAEPSFSTYSIFLLQPKKREATQLTTDRQLKNGTTLNSTNGAAANFTEGVDYITHPDVLGTTINTKYWKVLYKKEVNFSHPNGNSFNRTISANNWSTRNNAIIQEGTIKVPGGTTIRNFNRTPYEETSSPVLGFMKTSASQIGFVDEPNHATCYLAIVNNGASADGETINLSMLTRDYYKVVV